jgi:hypothetical protein
LGAALDKLAKDFDLPYELNAAAFKFGMEPDVRKRLIVDPEPVLPMKGARVEAVLRRVLSHIMVDSDATFLLRRDHIEITTGTFLALEIFGGDAPGPRFPLVNLTADQRPLDKWLDTLSEQTGQNIFLDPTVGERARTPVGVRLYNVPLDLAVHMLARSAGLKTVEVVNVLCLTDKEKVSELRALPINRLSRTEAARRWQQQRHFDERDLNPLLLLPKP